MPKDKKQRHKARREAKKLALRKQNSMSPIKRLATASGKLDCRMSANFKRLGQMQIFVHKQSDSLDGMACFLIDRGVVGLKDAWTRMDVDDSEFDEMIGMASRSGPLRKVSAEEVRRWIAGAIRFTHDNGMRLPKDWQRTVALIGGVGDWKSADVSAFEMEFAGHPTDLRQRLIGDTFDNYIRRPDVRFIFSDAAPYQKDASHGGMETVFDGAPLAFEDDDTDLDDDDNDNDSDSDSDSDDNEPEDMLDAFSPEQQKIISRAFDDKGAKLAGATRDWLKTHQQEPAPKLEEAWHVALLGLTISDARGATELVGWKLAPIICGMLESTLLRRSNDDIAPALRQVIDYLRVDPQLLLKESGTIIPDAKPAAKRQSFVRRLLSLPFKALG